MVAGSRETVLHVTDLAEASGGIAAALQAAGFEVRNARIPDHALADRLADVDLVILDTHVDGPIRLEFVRALKRAPDAPALLGLSAAGSRTTDPDSVEVDAQCDALLRTPVEPAELVGTVRRLLKTRHAEQDLQKRERFLLTLLESGSDIIAVLDADSTIRYESPAIRRILGYTVDELVGRKAFELIHPEDLPRIQEAYRVGVDMPDASAAMQFRFRHKNGSWRLLDGVGRNLLHDSILHGIVVQLRDITDRAIVDRALRNSEERYRRVLHTAHEGVWVLDAELKITYANQRMATMLGVPLDELIGASALDFLDEGRKAEARVYLERRRQGVPDQHDFMLLRRDGTELWVIVCASPMFDENGAFTGVLAMLTDITERKKAERRIERSEQKFRMLFAGNPQPMWVYDAETFELLEVNDAAIARYEYSREQMMQMRVTDIASAEEVAVIPRGAEASAAPVLPSGPWRHRSRTGASFEVETVRLSLEFAGRPGVLVVVSDVTERQRLEEQLRHSQRIEAVGKLAGGVAHDFNNLLTVITGRSRFLLREIPEGDARRRDVELITSTVDRATELTRQLLAFSRRQVLEPELLDLRSVLRDMTLLLRRVIGEDIELLVKAQDQLPAVRADRGQLEQIIVNLAVNARDAMPQGGRLTLEIDSVVVDEAFVRRTPDAAPGRHVVLTVRDSGVGMDEHVRAKVFEPFFTTKEQGKGTGLGLATVYGIVRQHQGFITVESEATVGSAFTVYLPAADGVPGETRSTAPTTDTLHGHEAVLVVEDDESVRQLVGEILRGHGYNVLEAREPAEGLQVAEQHAGELHLLITDVIMPKTSGRALADVLTIRRPALKVLYMSGYTDDAIAHHGVLDPGTALLQKPFEPETLLKQVRAILAGDAGSVRPAAPPAATPEKPVAAAPRDSTTAESDRPSLPLERGVRILDQDDEIIDEVLASSEWSRFGSAPPIDAPTAPVTGVMPERLQRRARTRGHVLIVDDDHEVSSVLARDLEEAGYGVTTVDDGEKALTAVIKEEPDVVLLDLGMPRLNGIETLGALRAIAPMLQVIIVSGAGTPQDAARARAFCAFDYVPKPVDAGYLVGRVEAALHVDYEGPTR